MTKYEKEDKKLIWLLFSSAIIAVLLVTLLRQLTKIILQWE